MLMQNNFKRVWKKENNDWIRKIRRKKKEEKKKTGKDVKC